MKRIVLFIVVFLLFVITFCTSVFSQSNNVLEQIGIYSLEELGIALTVPLEYDVITRNTPEDDLVFVIYQTTKSDVMNIFKTGNIYLNALSDTHNEEIVVTMVSSNLSDFGGLSDTVLNTLSSSFDSQLSEYGIIVSKKEIYSSSNNKYIKVYHTDENKTVHVLQYYTVYDGKAINFTMRSYEGDITSRQESAIKSIVDSVKYNKKNEPIVVTPYGGNNTKDIKDENRASFIYTDKNSGVSFTVPENWKQEALTKEREVLDAKFVSTKELGCQITYGSTDVWSQLSEAEKKGKSRSDYSNAHITKEEYADILGINVDKISVLTYNNVQYFKLETDYSSSINEVDLTITMTQLAHIENGWMYLFQFTGTSTDNLYSDFESLLNSVRYPADTSENEKLNSSNAQSTTKNNYTTNDSANNPAYNNDKIITIIMILSPIIIAIIIVVIIQKKKTNKNQENYTSQFNTDTLGLQIETNTNLICSNCGQSLPLDSEFCHYCGTRIDHKDNSL